MADIQESPRGGDRAIDGLLAAIPQEAAASTYFVKDLGSSVLISCQGLSPEESTLVGTLEPEEYSVLLLASSGMTYGNIEADLSVPGGTAADDLTQVYTKLFVDNRTQASTFIPVEEKRLRSVPMFKRNEEGQRESILGADERGLISLLADGFPDRYIAEIQGYTTGTIKSHEGDLSKKLGLNGAIELRRIAGALRNLQHYARLVGNIATVLQPVVTGVISGYQELEGVGMIDLEGPVISTVRKPGLLAKLAEGEYISAESAASGKVDLAGLTAAYLMNHSPRTERLMTHELSRPTVRTVINEEIAAFASSRK